MGTQLGKHGKYFICGFKPTIADFAIAALIFSFVKMKTTFSKEFEEITNDALSTNSFFKDYIDRLENELMQFLVQRKNVALWDHPATI